MARSVNLNRPFDPRLFLIEQELDRGAGLLLSGADELSRAAQQAARKSGLNKAEMHVLMSIRYRPGRTVSEVRTQLGMTVPTFARILTQLDRRGLIERERQAADGRRRRLNLSESGEAVTTPVAEAVRERLGMAFRAVGPEAVAGARLLLEALVR